MSIEILMPALSPTMEKGTLARWRVKVGDHVSSGDVIAEVETDKASMEVEAAEGGVIDVLLFTEGSENVPVNTPIARMRAEEAATARQALAPSPSVDPAPPAREAAPLTSAIPVGAQAPQSSAPPAVAAEPPAGEPAAAQKVMATPLARRMAEQVGLDLASICGSGPHGRIVKIDIDARLSPAPARAPSAVAIQSPPEPQRAALTLEEQGIPAGSYELVPLDGMRRTIARRLTESFRDVPHFPLTVDVELDALLAARAEINALLENSGVKISINDMVIKAAAVALQRVPAANASYTPDGIALHRHADIAVAVSLEGGLITPIVRAAETKGLGQIAKEMKDLAGRARARGLKPEEYQGGAFSISNLGMFGVRSFASILNAPQGCILSVGMGEKRPVVRGDQLEIATVMSVTLTCDHRVVDGAIGALWLSAFKRLIENPLLMSA